jgi:hypothetical protein
MAHIGQQCPAPLRNVWHSPRPSLVHGRAPGRRLRLDRRPTGAAILP